MNCSVFGASKALESVGGVIGFRRPAMSALRHGFDITRTFPTLLLRQSKDPVASRATSLTDAFDRQCSVNGIHLTWIEALQNGVQNFIGRTVEWLEGVALGAVRYVVCFSADEVSKAPCESGNRSSKLLASGSPLFLTTELVALRNPKRSADGKYRADGLEPRREVWALTDDLHWNAHGRDAATILEAAA